MFYWQLRKSQQCWEQLEQSFGGEKRHPELYTGAGRKPAKGEMLQKNGGDASGAVEELFLAAIQKSLAAPCQSAYSAATLSQRQCQQGWVQRALIDAGSPTCSLSRVVTNVLPAPLTRGDLDTLPATSSSEPCSTVLVCLASEVSTLPFPSRSGSLAKAGCLSSSNTASVRSCLSCSEASPEGNCTEHQICVPKAKNRSLS